MFTFWDSLTLCVLAAVFVTMMVTKTATNTQSVNLMLLCMAIMRYMSPVGLLLTLVSWTQYYRICSHCQFWSASHCLYIYRYTYVGWFQIVGVWPKLTNQFTIISTSVFPRPQKMLQAAFSFAGNIITSFWSTVYFLHNLSWAFVELFESVFV